MSLFYVPIRIYSLQPNKWNVILQIGSYSGSWIFKSDIIFRHRWRSSSRFFKCVLYESFQFLNKLQHFFNFDFTISSCLSPWSPRFKRKLKIKHFPLYPCPALCSGMKSHATKPTLLIITSHESLPRPAAITQSLPGTRTKELQNG